VLSSRAVVGLRRRCDQARPCPLGRLGPKVGVELIEHYAVLRPLGSAGSRSPWPTVATAIIGWFARGDADQTTLPRCRRAEGDGDRRRLPVDHGHRLRRDAAEGTQYPSSPRRRPMVTTNVWSVPRSPQATRSAVKAGTGPLPCRRRAPSRRPSRRWRTPRGRRVAAESSQRAGCASRLSSSLKAPPAPRVDTHTSGMLVAPWTGAVACPLFDFVSGSGRESPPRAGRRARSRPEPRRRWCGRWRTCCRPASRPSGPTAAGRPADRRGPPR
jgi:hypothetical protein